MRQLATAIMLAWAFDAAKRFLPNGLGSLTAHQFAVTMRTEQGTRALRILMQSEKTR